MFEQLLFRPGLLSHRTAVEAAFLDLVFGDSTHLGVSLLVALTTQSFDSESFEAVRLGRANKHKTDWPQRLLHHIIHQLCARKHRALTVNYERQ